MCGHVSNICHPIQRNIKNCLTKRTIMIWMNCNNIHFSTKPQTQTFSIQNHHNDGSHSVKVINSMERIFFLIELPQTSNVNIIYCFQINFHWFSNFSHIKFNLNSMFIQHMSKTTMLTYWFVLIKYYFVRNC